MEDKKFIGPTNIAEHFLIALFDGHGGSETAEYLAINILRLLEQSDAWGSYTKLSKTDQSGTAGTDLLCDALIQTFMSADEELRLAGVISGSTAVCVLITPSHILAASAGNSTVIVSA